MSEMRENRRLFLRRAALAAAGLPFLLSCRTGSLAQRREEGVLELIKRRAVAFDGPWNGAKDAPANVSHVTVLSKETDRGEPLIVAGTVFGADGKPAPNVLLYLYHTDAAGYYGRGGGEHRHGRFRGWLLTDEKGGYEFRTIKAAPYPERRFAAHIHMTVTTVDLNEASVDSILFEGDRLISALEREEAGKKGGFNPILTLEKGAHGILRGRRDIRLRTA
jgi:protocatechuate 3,4-dioxygenase, beta subunit